jgi:hypothetical protein
MKKVLILTAMTLLPLWGAGSFLYAQGSVNVTLLNAAPGAPASLTFSVEWADGSRSDRHRDSVWVFADFQPIDANGNAGAWKAATFAVLPTVIDGAGTVVASSFNGRGFYLAGSPSGAFASTLTATLTEPANDKFNACLYVSDYPPNATINAGGGYTLHGTPPFIINGNIRETTHTFAAGTCITGLTDSTRCPGWLDNGAAFAVGAIATLGENICTGSTPGIISSMMPVSGGDQSEIYSWYKDGAPIPDATGANYTPPPADAAAPGAHTYTRKVRDNTCNTIPALSTGSWVLTVNALPTLSSANNPAICYGQTANLSVTGSAAGTYSWTVGGAAAQTTSDGNYITAALTTSTAYSVTLTDANGCTSAAATGNITVNPVPDAPVVSGGGTQCGGTLDISATIGTNGDCIYWNDDGSDHSTTRSIGTTGSYYARTYNSVTGCWSAAGNTVSVTINPVPDAPVVSGGGTQCGGTLDISATIGTNGDCIYWNDDIYGSDNTVTTRSIGATGSYYARTYNSVTGCWSAAGNTVSVTINPVPAAPTNASANSRCSSGTVTFSAAAPGDCTIDWYDASIGGTQVATGITSYSPSLSNSTTYYAQTRNITTNCVSTSRLAVMATVSFPGSAGQAPTSCGCVTGTTNCGSTCVSGGNYTTYDGACYQCFGAYSQRRNPCGVVIDEQYSTYQNLSCDAGCPEYSTNCGTDTWAGYYEVTESDCIIYCIQNAFYAGYSKWGYTYNPALTMKCKCYRCN